jgi:hypothetical protein
MERLDADVGATDRPLEQAPGMFEAIRVDVAFGIAFGMVDHVVNVLPVQPCVRRQRIRIDSRTGFHIVPDLRVQMMPAGVRKDAQADLRAFWAR